ncbi:Serine/threonine-protein phosphatase 7 long form homolog [Linum perenne]
MLLSSGGENKHRAGFVWRSPAECKALKIRQRSTSLGWSPQYQPFLEGCRLSGVLPVLGQTPCKELVTALIERWRPETNTFHLVPGEATITLEDVEVLTGLPTTGRPLIVSPDEQHSWGSAVLAWLYKVMGRAAFFAAGSMRGTGDIGGFTLLVELWALERFPLIAERYIHGGVPPVDDTVSRGARWVPIIARHQHRVAMHLQDIRYAFDLCTDFVWMPYADRSEEFALDGDILWRSVTPLLCIDCIAWHHPDRCIRQFGFDQRIPQDPAPAGHIESLLAADFRSSVTDWVAKYQEFVLQWEQRGSHIATGELVSDDWRHHFHDEYDEWYRRRTRLAISRGGAQYQMMVCD